MPFDSEGNFTRVHNWDEDRQNNIDIASDRMDEEFDNYSDGLNDCFLRDGRVTMRGDLMMGNFQVKKVAKGTVGTDAVNKEQVDEITSRIEEALKELLNQQWKIGDIKSSVREENHGAWFLCDGQEISRVTYSSLFDIIGTNFGEGDGVTTFNLPDYRGKFLRGLGGDSAEDIYTTQKESLPNITGNIWGYACVSNAPTVTGALYSDGNGSHQRFSASGSSDRYWRNITLDASKSNSIYAGSHVTPVNQAVNFFIKVSEEA